ncbi:MAG: NAD(P)/FAD-dependent oxidoreductase [Candidatus Diapherotrites archaeon]|uniref:NAD(P)/FAD-dependent oxidoreductase n=1 Tax=Candidatus Iainarchaeum sp. TaxID=3101447 RepID=A0A8T4C652_9ARCH|nr:NAD(P)/FAD-dependent oxidoreductase [Candidatus Diapherotrites archaeon]
MPKVINIAGAGLGGLTAAVLLSEKFDVHVYEKNGNIGKPGGDDIEAVRNYGMGYDQIKFLHDNGIILKHTKPITKIVKYAPSGKSMTVHSENGPLFHAFMRGPNKLSVESQLFEQAKERGVKFSFNTRKNYNEVDIVATGSVYRNVWVYGSYIKGVDVDPQKILFFMDNDYSPHGYLYLIPYGPNEVTIAAGTDDFSCPLPRLLKSFIEKNEVISNLLKGASVDHNIAGFAYYNVPESAEVNNVKFVGGAAGFLDASRGFGAKYALESGIFAARAILENISYDALWKSAFEKELIDSFNRRLLHEKFSNSDYEKLLHGDEVSVSRYNKMPIPFRDSFEKLRNSMALTESRKKYSLEKLFSTT